MRIHAFLECSLVNGPGRRAVLWVQGCRLACPNCWNPKSHSMSGGSPVSTRDLARRIRHEYDAGRIEGLTLSGGEPLHQIAEVLSLLRNLNREAPELSTGLFSGYTEHELQQGRFQTYFPSSIWFRQAQWRQLESVLDFAVLGRYNQQQPSTDPLITSRNQQLRLYSSRYHPADFHEQTVEVSIESDGLTHVTGFPILGSIF
ncbi:MAG: radical SAM protein [Acidobacteriaceae bacterium]|nr:radical SAM protein [Acidobacteriaceae bacterium]